jgi:hypothetical protein
MGRQAKRLNPQRKRVNVKHWCAAANLSRGMAGSAKNITGACEEELEFRAA